MLNWDRVGLIVFFFIPALWQGRSANPTLFSQKPWDACEMISFKLKLFQHLSSLFFVEIHDLGQRVSGGVIEIDAVVSAAPDEHFVAGPNGRMQSSLCRCATGGHGLPGVRGRTVISAIIEEYRVC